MLAACGDSGDADAGAPLEEAPSLHPERVRVDACTVAACVDVCGTPVFVGAPAAGPSFVPAGVVDSVLNARIDVGTALWEASGALLQRFDADGLPLGPTGLPIAAERLHVIDPVVVSAPGAAALGVVSAGRFVSSTVLAAEGIQAASVAAPETYFVRAGARLATFAPGLSGPEADIRCFDVPSPVPDGEIVAFATSALYAAALYASQESSAGTLVIWRAVGPEAGGLVGTTPGVRPGPVRFLHGSLVEVGEGEVGHFRIGEFGIAEAEVPEGWGESGALIGDALGLRDGRVFYLNGPASFEATLVEGLEDGIACRVAWDDGTGSKVALPRHFPGQVFEQDEAPEVDCALGPWAPGPLQVAGGRTIVAGEGVAAGVDTAGVAWLLPDTGDARRIGQIGPWEEAWLVRDALVTIRRDGTDFGMAITSTLTAYSLADGAERGSATLEGRVFVARADAESLWLVAEDRAAEFDEPPPDALAVLRVVVGVDSLVVERLPLGPRARPRDAVPDGSGGAWVFDADGSIVHVDADGDELSRSDIPPRTSPVGLTKAANADGLLVADGGEAWWYDAAGIRRVVTSNPIRDVVGATPEGYWVEVGAVAGLPVGAEGPVSVALVRVERQAEGVVVVPTAMWPIRRGAQVVPGDPAWVVDGDAVRLALPE